MKEKPDVLQGTLARMVLKTLDVLEPQHGYGTPNPPLRSVMPPGSMRPSLKKAAHEAVEGEHVRGIRGIARRIEQISGEVLAVNQGTLWIASQWGASENNSRARFYRMTAVIIARFFEVRAEDLP
jgi:PadR family transcriptional regulator, regulatory protein PadR